MGAMPEDPAELPPDECPHPDCRKPIAETSFCCLVHWKALTYKGRQRITREPRSEEQLRIAGNYWFPR